MRLSHFKISRTYVDSMHLFCVRLSYHVYVVMKVYADAEYVSKHDFSAQRQSTSFYSEGQ